MNIALSFIYVLIINLPFGYWRANVKKFSLQWALAIHAPIPIVLAIRLLNQLGFEFYTYPILVSAFFIGQLIGGRIHSNRKTNLNKKTTSCLVMDLIKSGEN